MGLVVSGVIYCVRCVVDRCVYCCIIFIVF